MNIGEMMDHKIMLIAAATFIAGCASTPALMPTELTVKDPIHRFIDDRAGSTREETGTKCAHNLVNAAPSSEKATNIQYRFIGVDNPLIVELDAVLSRVGYRTSFPVTYRCEYSNGIMIRSGWTRGL